MEFTWRHWLIQHEWNWSSLIHGNAFLFPTLIKTVFACFTDSPGINSRESFRTERAQSRDSKVALAWEKDGVGCEGTSTTTTADILVPYSCPPTQLKLSPAFSGTGHSPGLSSGLRTSLNPCRHHNLEWHFNHIREGGMGLPGQGFFTCGPCSTGGPQRAWRWSAGWLQLKKWNHTHCIPKHSS